MNRMGTANFHGAEKLKGVRIFNCKYQLHAKSEIVINSPQIETRIGNQHREGETFKLNFERGVGFNQVKDALGGEKGTGKGPEIGQSSV